MAKNKKRARNIKKRLAKGRLRHKWTPEDVFKNLVQMGIMDKQKEK